MEWFVFAAPIPGPVDFTVGSGLTFAALLAVALTPVAVALRATFKLHAAPAAPPQLRVIEGRKELGQQAA